MGAMDLLVEFCADYISKLGRTIRSYIDHYSKELSPAVTFFGITSRIFYCFL